MSHNKKSITVILVLNITLIFFFSCRNNDEFVIIESFAADSIIEEMPQTGLPVVEIWTSDGQGIADKETWHQATFSLYGEEIEEIHNRQIQVKGRGNITMQFPKKSFTIKFEEKQKVLGMKKHKRWVFLANYHDRTLLRNSLTFYLGSIADNMEWNPSGKYVEVMFNGHHVGNFFLCEQIRVDKNRVNIDEMTEDDISGEALTGGYLLQLDSYFDETNQFRSKNKNLPIEIINPDEDICQQQQIAYIQDFINNMEDALMNKKFNIVFDKFLDIDSFIDYYIIQTLSGNIEIENPRSVYCYKKRDGKLYAGPLWDFDFSTYRNTNKTDNKNSIWYDYLFESSEFKDKLCKRWSILKPQFKTKGPLFIQEQSELLMISQAKNWKLFPINVFYQFKARNGDEQLSYPEAISLLNTTLIGRIDYLDKIINE